MTITPSPSGLTGKEHTMIKLINYITTKSKEWSGEFPYRFYFITHDELYQMIITDNSSVVSGIVKPNEVKGTIIKTVIGSLDKLNIEFFLENTYDEEKEREDIIRQKVTGLSFNPTSTLLIHDRDYQRAIQAAATANAIAKKRNLKIKKGAMLPLLNDFWDAVRYGKVLGGKNNSPIKENTFLMFKGITNKPLDINEVLREINEQQPKDTLLSFNFSASFDGTGICLRKTRDIEKSAPLKEFVLIDWKKDV